MRTAFQISFFRWKLSIAEWAWIFFFISLPAGRPFTTYTLVLLTVVAVFSARKNFCSDLKQHFKIILPFLIFYFFHITGLLYTDDFEFAFKDLSVKLPLVLLPVLALTSGMTQSFRSGSAIAFAFSCVMVNIFLLINAAVNFLNGAEDAFFYDTYSTFVHPAYMALMNAMATAILLFRKELQLPVKNAILLTCLTILSVSAIFMASKSGLISLLLVYGVYIFRTIDHKKKLRAVLAFCAVIFFSGILICISPVKHRLKQSFEVLLRPENAAAMQEGTASRLLAWKTAWQISKDYFPLGTGTGDIKNVTLIYYEKSGYQWPLYYRLNAHNQFLQSLSATGIGSLISLVLMLLFPFVKRNRKSLLPLLFSALVLINLLVESMLEVQNGVMFIAAFYSLWATRMPAAQWDE